MLLFDYEKPILVILYFCNLTETDWIEIGPSGWWEKLKGTVSSWVCKDYKDKAMTNKSCIIRPKTYVKMYFIFIKNPEKYMVSTKMRYNWFQHLKNNYFEW